MGREKSFGQSVLILVVVGILVSSCSFVKATPVDVHGDVCPQTVDFLMFCMSDTEGNGVYRVEKDTVELVSDTGLIQDASGLVR